MDTTEQNKHQNKSLKTEIQKQDMTLKARLHQGRSL